MLKEVYIQNIGAFFLSKNNFFNTVLYFIRIAYFFKRFVPFQKAVMLLIFEDQVSEAIHFKKFCSLFSNDVLIIII